MYLYYLIGWKLDACQEMMNQQTLEKDKCFILALDGDVDFDPPALDLGNRFQIIYGGQTCQPSVV